MKSNAIKKNQKIKITFYERKIKIFVTFLTIGRVHSLI